MLSFAVEVTECFFCITFALIAQLYLHLIKFISHLSRQNDRVLFIDFSDNVWTIYKDICVDDVVGKATLI